MTDRSIRSVDFNDDVAQVGQEARESGSVGTRAFYTECADLSQATRPLLELYVSKSGCRCVVLAEADTQLVNGHCYMLVLVSVYTDYNLNRTVA